MEKLAQDLKPGDVFINAGKEVKILSEPKNDTQNPGRLVVQTDLYGEFCNIPPTHTFTLQPKAA